MKQGVTWHDGKPFTATTCLKLGVRQRTRYRPANTSAVYTDVIGAEDRTSNTVKVRFPQPTPFWASPLSAPRA